MKQKRGGEKVSCVPAGSILIQLYLTGILFFHICFEYSEEKSEGCKKTVWSASPYTCALRMKKY